MAVINRKLPIKRDNQGFMSLFSVACILKARFDEGRAPPLPNKIKEERDRLRDRDQLRLQLKVHFPN